MVVSGLGLFVVSFSECVFGRDIFTTNRSTWRIEATLILKVPRCYPLLSLIYFVYVLKVIIKVTELK